MATRRKRGSLSANLKPRPKAAAKHRAKVTAKKVTRYAKALKSGSSPLLTSTKGTSGDKLGRKHMVKKANARVRRKLTPKSKSRSRGRARS